MDSAMNALVTETQRVKQFGFTPSEYDRARINVLKQYESLYNDRDKQRNSTFTKEYVRHFTEGGYIPGIETEYAPDQPGCTGCTGRTGQQVYPGYDQRYQHRDQPDRSEKEGLSYPTDEELLRDFMKAQQIPCRTLPGDLIGRTVDPRIAGARQDHGKQGRSALSALPS